MRPKALLLTHSAASTQQAAAILAFHGFNPVVSLDVEGILDLLWEADEPFRLICVDAAGLPAAEIDTLIGIVAEDWPETKLFVTSCTRPGMAGPHVTVTDRPLTAGIVTDMLADR